MPLIEDENEIISLWAKKAMQRFVKFEDGSIRDTVASNESVWWIPLSELEMWLADIESILGISTGRRFSNAAYESEILRTQNHPRRTIRNRFSKTQQEKDSIALEKSEWSMRGLGTFTILEYSQVGARIQLEHAAHGSLCAGLILAMFERVTKTPGEHRHRWNDLGNGKTVVIIEKDRLTTPLPTRGSPQGGPVTPNNLRNTQSGSTHILEHSTNAAGAVSIDGIRMTALDAESIVRFSDSTSLILAAESPSSESIQENRWQWPKNLRDSESRFYTAMAEATNRAFIRSESLVLALDSDAWIRIGWQHLGLRGLGAVLSAKLDDGNLILECTSCIHPALIVGTISACWERAMGRKAATQLLNLKSGIYQIKIKSLHTISKQPEL